MMFFTTIFIVDVVLIGLILLWLGWINIVGNTDQKGGAGLAAFMMMSFISVVSFATALVGLFINLIWG